ncbi:MAG: hypothetical protein J5I94_08240 [Phaeodactylibacter sp.]|nr:hypothetical protein [Phaeodactylibacter sp.]
MTDGACLSTTGHLIAHLQAQGIGVTIGETPGSFASCNDNSTRVALPYSGLQANIARSTFTIALPEGVELEGPVLARKAPVTIESLLKGKDAGLEACFQLIKEQE